MNKPALLFYCQQSEGVGQLVRYFALGTRLSDEFDVAILTSGPTPPEIVVPQSIRLLQLQPIAVDIDSSVVSPEDRQALKESLKSRRKTILETCSALKPRVLVIELFPFGRRNLEDELLPLIEHARKENSGDALVLCSLRDMLVGDRRGQQQRDDEIAGMLEKYFDAVLVHSDPVFARLEEFFQPQNALSTPVHYTGFVVPGDGARQAAGKRQESVLVSAGAGMVGMPLFRAAVEAHRILWDVERLPMTIIAGPLLPAGEWLDLQEVARRLPGLTLKKTVSNLGDEIGKVHWSVSQCGYNTAMQILVSGTSAIFVPYSSGRKMEQIDRAQRLAHRGASRLLMPHHLNGASLANEIQQLTAFDPRPTDFNFDGADNTAMMIRNMAHSGNVALMPHGTGKLA